MIDEIYLDLKNYYQIFITKSKYKSELKIKEWIQKKKLFT